MKSEEAPPSAALEQELRSRITQLEAQASSQAMNLEKELEMENRVPPWNLERSPAYCSTPPTTHPPHTRLALPGPLA